MALAETGVEVVKGNLDDRASLDRALAGVDGIFGVQDYWEHGAAAEVRQGKLLADAAKAAGVGHFVYASVGGAEATTGVEHYDSKGEIERHITSIDLPATFLRPTFFMDLFRDPKYRPEFIWSTLVSLMSRDKPVQFIAVDDIGAVARIVFERPTDFMGRAVELAGDEMTVPDAIETYRAVFGRKPRYICVPLQPLTLFSRHLSATKRWMNEVGWHADIAALRAFHPGLRTLRQWFLEVAAVDDAPSRSRKKAA